MKRALIVDDNRALAEDLAEILTDEGYEVAAFRDPRQAAQHASILDFDVALLDIRMPDLDGITLQQQLVQCRPDAHFVLMTAYSDDKRLQAIRPRGICRVLTKPLRVDELLVLLEELDQRCKHAPRVPGADR